MIGEGAESPAGQRSHLKIILVVIIGALMAITSAIGGYYLLSDSSEGVPSTPKCAIARKDPGQYSFAITNLTSDASQWSAIEILLFNASSGVMLWSWEPPYRSLTDPNREMITESFVGIGWWNEESLTVVCNVTDLQGDGKPDNGDYFTLIVTGGHLSPDYLYEVTLFYEDTAEPMGTLQFPGES